MAKELIMVLDRGSETQHIAKCVRSLGVYCEVAQRLTKAAGLKGVVIAGEKEAGFDGLPMGISRRTVY